MISDSTLDAMKSLAAEFRQLTLSLDSERAGPQPAEGVSADQASRLEILATAIHETVARFAAVVEITEQASAAGSALRETEAYQDAYRQLQVLADAFTVLQSTTAASQRASAEEAGATRRRYNAAQRYLDTSRH